MFEKIIQFTNAKKNSDGFVGHCPAHDDKNPSLSIKFVDELRTPLLYCFAGCSQSEVIQAFIDNDCWFKGDCHE